MLQFGKKTALQQSSDDEDADDEEKEEEKEEEGDRADTLGGNTSSTDSSSSKGKKKDKGKSKMSANILDSLIVRAEELVKMRHDQSAVPSKPKTAHEEQVATFVTYYTTQLHNIPPEHWFNFTVDSMNLVQSYIVREPAQPQLLVAPPAPGIWVPMQSPMQQPVQHPRAMMSRAGTFPPSQTATGSLQPLHSPPSFPTPSPPKAGYQGPPTPSNVYGTLNTPQTSPLSPVTGARTPGQTSNTPATESETSSQNVIGPSYMTLLNNQDF